MTDEKWVDDDEYSQLEDSTYDGLDQRYTCATCDRPRVEHTPLNNYCPGVGQMSGPSPGWNTWQSKRG